MGRGPPLGPPWEEGGPRPTGGGRAGRSGRGVRAASGARHEGCRPRAPGWSQTRSRLPRGRAASTSRGSLAAATAGRGPPLAEPRAWPARGREVGTWRRLKRAESGRGGRRGRQRRRRRAGRAPPREVLETPAAARVQVSAPPARSPVRRRARAQAGGAGPCVLPARGPELGAGGRAARSASRGRSPTPSALFPHAPGFRARRLRPLPEPRVVRSAAPFLPVPAADGAGRGPPLPCGSGSPGVPEVGGGGAGGQAPRGRVVLVRASFLSPRGRESLALAW